MDSKKERQRRYRERKKEKLRQKAVAYRTDKKWGDIELWTKVNLALEGKLDGDEYNFLEHNYASYGPDGLRIVGPSFGPIHIQDSPEARAKFAEMACGSKLEK